LTEGLLQMVQIFYSDAVSRGATHGTGGLFGGGAPARSPEDVKTAREAIEALRREQLRRYQAARQVEDTTSEQAEGAR
jgi:hypothetical protein